MINMIPDLGLNQPSSKPEHLPVCKDYEYGFCSKGPDCKLKHVKLSESSRKKKLASIPKEYLERMTEYFKQIKGGVTDLG